MTAKAKALAQTFKQMATSSDRREEPFGLNFCDAEQHRLMCRQIEELQRDLAKANQNLKDQQGVSMLEIGKRKKLEQEIVLLKASISQRDFENQYNNVEAILQGMPNGYAWMKAGMKDGQVLPPSSRPATPAIASTGPNAMSETKEKLLNAKVAELEQKLEKAQDKVKELTATITSLHDNLDDQKGISERCMQILKTVSENTLDEWAKMQQLKMIVEEASVVPNPTPTSVPEVRNVVNEAEGLDSDFDRRSGISALDYSPMSVTGGGMSARSAAGSQVGLQNIQLASMAKQVTDEEIELLEAMFQMREN